MLKTTRALNPSGLVIQEGPWKPSKIDKLEKNTAINIGGGGVPDGGTLHAGHAFWKSKITFPIENQNPKPSLSLKSTPIPLTKGPTTSKIVTGKSYIAEIFQPAVQAAGQTSVQPSNTFTPDFVTNYGQSKLEQPMSAEMDVDLSESDTENIIPTKRKNSIVQSEKKRLKKPNKAEEVIGKRKRSIENLTKNKQKTVIGQAEKVIGKRKRSIGNLSINKRRELIEEPEKLIGKRKRSVTEETINKRRQLSENEANTKGIKRKRENGEEKERKKLKLSMKTKPSLKLNLSNLPPRKQGMMKNSRAENKSAISKSGLPSPKNLRSK